MRSAMLRAAAALAALALGGCQSDATLGVPLDGPSTTPPFVASVRPAPVAIAGINVLGRLTSPCEVVISASRPVDLHEVTIRMTDGSNLGGPMVTFPTPTLTSAFDSRRVPSGATRVFSLPCHAAGPPWTILIADIACIDTHAFVHHVTVRRQWP